MTASSVETRDIDAANNPRLKRIVQLMRHITSLQRTVIITFSGGKDSTLLLHLASIAFLPGSESRAKLKRLYILFNDTLAELPHLHFWANKLGKHYEKLFSEHGIEAHFVTVKPPITDTFYWRSVLRGYPAPTFRFRWCVTLLKINPLKRVLSVIAGRINESVALLSGLRRDESPARAKSLSSRTIGCSVDGGPSCLGAYMLRHDFGSNIVRYAPIRELGEKEVWELLLSLNAPPACRELSYEYLHTLYFPDEDDACKRVRFGCWFCTVSSKHCGLKASIKAAEKLSKWVRIPRRALIALWLVRLLYRRVSDAKVLREPKEKGYSRLGPLKPEARAMLLQALKVVYNIDGGREALYGLKEEVERGVSLATLFFSLEEDYARSVIRRLDASTRVFSDIALLRDEDFVKRRLEALKRSGGRAEREVSSVEELYEAVLSLRRGSVSEDELRVPEAKRLTS